jgi:hypothetical protein
LACAVRAPRLFSDGHWARLTPGDQPAVRSQARFLTLAAESADRLPSEPGILAPLPADLVTNGRGIDGRMREPVRRLNEAKRHVAG